MLRAVIFDMDGTLVDTESLHKQVEAEMFQELGLEISPEEHAVYTGLSLGGFWDIIRKKFMVERSLDELVERNENKFLEVIRRLYGLHPMPGLVPLLNALESSGVALAVATSASRGIMNGVMELFQIGHFFPLKICADDVVAAKPSPEIFLKTVRELGVSEDECVVIEDSFNGVLAAKRAGIVCVGYTNHGKNIQDLSSADILVSDYAKLTVHDLERLRGK